MTRQQKEDGARFLVERLWPRGMKREAVQMDAWCRNVAPSGDLRRWFNHDPAKWKNSSDGIGQSLPKIIQPANRCWMQPNGARSHSYTALTTRNIIRHGAEVVLGRATER
jgi:uncharacterized protein YeaO (DUF488 family)